MSGPSNKTISAKALAWEVGVSVDTLRRREVEWGLDKCVSRSSVIPKLYFLDAVNETLIEKKVIDKPIKV